MERTEEALNESWSCESTVEMINFANGGALTRISPIEDEIIYWADACETSTPRDSNHLTANSQVQLENETKQTTKSI
jgi:hypothetical protein